VTRADLRALGAVLLLALGLRLYGVWHPPQRFIDEVPNMEGAVQYAERGHFEPDTWQHPPLRHLVGYAFLSALGDDPWGWRLKNVLLGAATAALAWAFALHATGNRRAALLAGLLVATDPLHVVLSRFTAEEIYGGALFLAGVVLWQARRDRTWGLVGAAALLGCALAIKWYWLLAWLLLLLILLAEDGRWRDLRTAAFVGCVWTLVPLTIYVASYLPWFGRGYGLAELPEHVANALAFQQWMTGEYVHATDGRATLQGHLSALEWFVRPIAVGWSVRPEQDTVELDLYANSLPVWILTLPAVIALAVHAIRQRRVEPALPVALFLALWLPLVVTRRPVFLYSASVVLPFAFTAVGWGIARVSERLGARLYWGALAALLAWNLYLYPLVTMRRVPEAAYRPVLPWVHVESP
jgi:dolichyl-phosphate-mannose--protein O-mannosyl transferase